MKQILFLVVGVMLTFSLKAQEVTLNDYERAVSFMYNNSYNKTVFNLFTDANWFKDNSGLWFIDYSKDTKSYKTVSFKKNKV